jgi:hypothetical protein
MAYEAWYVQSNNPAANVATITDEQIKKQCDYELLKHHRKLFELIYNGELTNSCRMSLEEQHQFVLNELTIAYNKHQIRSKFYPSEIKKIGCLRQSIT